MLATEEEEVGEDEEASATVPRRGALMERLKREGGAPIEPGTLMP